MSETDAKRPKPQAIDDLIFRYYVLKTALDMADVAKKAAQSDLDVVKAQVVALVQSYGAKHAEKSTKLTGIRNSAIITTGSSTSLVATAVEAFRQFLVKLNKPAVLKLFFTETTTYQLVASPTEVLNSLDVPAAEHKKLKGLLALCFEVTSKAPSLKVDVAETAAAA
jgi:hypothetical protein